MTEQFKPGDRVVLEGTYDCDYNDAWGTIKVKIDSATRTTRMVPLSALRHAPVREDAELRAIVRLWAVRTRMINAEGHTAANDLRADISIALTELQEILEAHAPQPDFKDLARRTANDIEGLSKEIIKRHSNVRRPTYSMAIFMGIDPASAHCESCVDVSIPKDEDGDTTLAVWPCDAYRAADALTSLSRENESLRDLARRLWKRGTATCDCCDNPMQHINDCPFYEAWEIFATPETVAIIDGFCTLCGRNVGPKYAENHDDDCHYTESEPTEGET